MTTPERKILVPDSYRVEPHPAGVCRTAWKLRDEILRKEDIENGRIYYGLVSRKIGVVSGCLIEIIPSEYQKVRENKI